ncbi:hypothetical protein [Lagierella sp.]|uniref:hypothetical protein n=1 Tax=Lagierella sp. TaxID=2849657 RepID=UPI00344DCE1E
MFGRGITSINDLIANILGSCVGYTIYKLIIKFIAHGNRKRFLSIKVNEGLEILFYWTICFIIMISIQPEVISFLFNLG